MQREHQPLPHPWGEPSPTPACSPATHTQLRPGLTCLCCPEPGRPTAAGRSAGGCSTGGALLGVLCRGALCRGVICRGALCLGALCQGALCWGVICRGALCQGVLYWGRSAGGRSAGGLSAGGHSAGGRSAGGRDLWVLRGLRAPPRPPPPQLLCWVPGLVPWRPCGKPRGAMVKGDDPGWGSGGPVGKCGEEGPSVEPSREGRALGLMLGLPRGLLMDRRGAF